MGRPAEWHQIALKYLDPRVYGRLADAYQHSRFPQILLVHHKPLSRQHRLYRQYGSWVVLDGFTVVRRKPYRFKCRKLAPRTWANKIVRAHLSGTFARQRAEREAALAALRRKFEEEQEAARVAPPEAEEETYASRLDALMYRCYQRSIGPLDDPPSPLPSELESPDETRPTSPSWHGGFQYIDDRPKSRRTLINYDVPAEPDELPKQLGLQRKRKDNFRRRMRYKRRRPVPPAPPAMDCLIPLLLLDPQEISWSGDAAQNRALIRPLLCARGLDGG